jgi:protein-tyrosine phosphatase
MAEAMLRRQVQQEGLTDWIVESAGTWAVAGAPASRYAIQVMAQRMLDVANHRSQPLDQRLLEQADLVLVMTSNHSEVLRLEYKDQWEKVFLLSEMKAGRRYDVADPYGGSLAEYQVCANVIADLVEAGWRQIRTLATQNARARDNAFYE